MLNSGERISFGNNFYSGGNKEKITLNSSAKTRVRSFYGDVRIKQKIWQFLFRFCFGFLLRFVSNGNFFVVFLLRF